MTNSQPQPQDQPTTPSAEDFQALAVLAGLDGIEAAQMPLLKIITDPANNHAEAIEGETHLELAEPYADFGDYMGYDHYSNVATVADFLYAHYSDQPDAPGFGFSWGCNTEGEITHYDVTATIGTDWQDRITLSVCNEPKHSTCDREATGLRQALAIAQSLDGDYQGLLTAARRRGLLPQA